MNTIDLNRCREEALFLTPEKERNIQLLPLEILAEIFKELAYLPIRDVSLVSKQWQLVALDSTKGKKIFAIKQLVDFINTPMLENFSFTQKKHFHLTLTDLIPKLLEATCIKQIEFVSYQVQKTTLDALKDLELKDLNKLQEIYCKRKEHYFVNQILYLAKIYHKIKQSSQIGHFQKQQILKRCCFLLIKETDTDKALEIAPMIFLDDRRYQLLLSIVDNLITQQSFYKAIEFTISIESSYHKDNAFLIISEKLIEKNYFKKALECAHRVTSKNLKNIFISLAVQLIEKNQIAKALEMIDKALTIDSSKIYTLDDLFFNEFVLKLVEKDALYQARKFIDKALEIKNKYSMKLKNFFNKLITVLVEKKYFDLAREIIYKIEDLPLGNSFLEKLPCDERYGEPFLRSIVNNINSFTQEVIDHLIL